MANLSSSVLVGMFAAFFYSTMVQATFVPFKRSDPGNSDFVSNVFSEEINNGFSGQMPGPVAGITCLGKFCDNKQLISVQRGDNRAVKAGTFWTDWFSEEGKNSAFCPFGNVLVEIQCRGLYCDDMRLHCASMVSGFRTDRRDTKTVPFFSEEQFRGFCDDGYYIYGITCNGQYCDNLKLHCERVDINL